MNRIRLVFHSTASLSVLGQALRVGAGIVTLPLALRLISQEELGLYYTFLSVSALVTLLDFGFGPTLSRFASYIQAGAIELTGLGIPATGVGPNLPLLAQLFTTSRIFYHRLAFLCLILLAVLGTWFVHDSLIAAALPKSLLGCWAVIVISTCFSLGTSYFSHLLLGIGRVRESIILQLQAQIITIILTLGLLLGGAGVWSYAWAGLAIGLYQRVRGKILLRRYAGLSGQQETSPAQIREIFKSLWPMAWRMGIVMVAAFFINRFNTVICAGALGLKETGSFGLTIQLIAVISAGTMAPLSVIWPRVAMLRANRCRDEVIALFAPRLYGCLALFAVGIAGLAYLGNPLLVLLGAKSQMLPTPMILLLGCVVGLETHHSAYTSLVITENENPFVSLAIFAGIGVVLASAILVRHMGVLGLILGQGGVQLAAANWIPVLRGIRGLEMKPVAYLNAVKHAIYLTIARHLGRAESSITGA